MGAKAIRVDSNQAGLAFTLFDQLFPEMISTINRGSNFFNIRPMESSPKMIFKTEQAHWFGQPGGGKTESKF